VKGCLERFVFNNQCVYNNGLVEDLRNGQNVNIYKNNLNFMSSSIELEKDDNIEIDNEKLDNYKLSNIINVEQFNRQNLRVLFKNACTIKHNIKKYGNLEILKGKTIGLYFDEPSSRTYGSFSVAVQKLGGNVLTLNDSISSTKKGESLYDTLKCIETYCDLIVIRTKEKNVLNNIQQRIKVPIINAGDGDGEHPTQALLDVFTIREERGTVNKLNVSIVGDLRYGRTVHSLVRLLSNYDITFNFVSIDELSLDENTVDFLNSKNIKYSVYNSITDVIQNTDILYMTRIQKERFIDENIDNNFITNNLYLSQEMLTNAKKNIVIMHPLPRNQEININIDNDPRAAYFRQMENGLYIRMALLQSLLC
jgi:aspartate carbamoyltransferase